MVDFRWRQQMQESPPYIACHLGSFSCRNHLRSLPSWLFFRTPLSKCITCCGVDLVGLVSYLPASLPGCLPVFLPTSLLASAPACPLPPCLLPARLLSCLCHYFPLQRSNTLSVSYRLFFLVIGKCVFSTQGAFLINLIVGGFFTASHGQ